MSKYTFYEDPGHGWLEVPMADLIEAGVADKISRCSYRDGDKAYLEEDCDMATFLQAKAGAPIEGAKDPYAKWRELYVWNDRATLWGAPEIWIRRLPNYYH